MKFAEMPSFQRSDQTIQMRALFINRLKRLIRVRQEYDEDLNNMGAELIDRAIYATYRDASDYGGADEALRLMTSPGEAR